jgi:GxxExxY protein
VKHIDEISRDVIGVAMRIHRELGPGLYENVYETILAGKLAELGFVVDRQKPIDIEFEGTHFPAAFKIDLLIDHRLIVEIKSVDQPTAAHAKQLLTYLRLSKLHVGLVINFGGATLKEGVRRLVNDHLDSNLSASSAPLREPQKG